MTCDAPTQEIIRSLLMSHEPDMSRMVRLARVGSFMWWGGAGQGGGAFGTPPCAGTPRAQAPRGALRAVTWHVSPISF